MEILKMKITGEGPMLMHSDTLADTLHPEALRMKQMTARFKNTVEGQTEVSRIDFMGGLYYNDIAGVHIPSYNFFSCVLAGAKLVRLGAKFKQGVVPHITYCPLKYDGPQTPDELWADPQFRDRRMVKIGQARIPRCRPRFDQWETELVLAVNTDVINLADVKKAAQDAGEFIGIGDFRPRFGRFTVEFL